MSSSHSHFRVRADLFQKCYHGSRIERGKKISGLI